MTTSPSTSATAAGVPGLTVPRLAERLSLPLDWVRKQLTRRQDLRGLLDEIHPRIRFLRPERVEAFAAMIGRPGGTTSAGPTSR